MSSGPITTIVADFGGVLSTPLASAFGAVREHLELPPEALGRAMAAVGAQRGAHPLNDLETGELPEAEFFALLGERLTAELGRDVVLRDFAERYWGALGPNDVLVEHLRRVRRGGYRMGLLTNNVREWEPRWRAMLPVEELFDEVVDSAAVGLRKPDPAIYALAGRELGVSGAQGLAIEDSVPGALSAVAAGFVTIGNVAFVAPQEHHERIAALHAAGVAEVVASWSELETMLS
ncbi:MAG: HAD-IA family hydrolase [Solirubrobacterales bacterium]|nr:HAD-IA family hydrolase [Solirubrobacterales bacterium]